MQSFKGPWVRGSDPRYRLLVPSPGELQSCLQKLGLCGIGVCPERLQGWVLVLTLRPAYGGRRSATRPVTITVIGEQSGPLGL